MALVLNRGGLAHQEQEGRGQLVTDMRLLRAFVLC